MSSNSAGTIPSGMKLNGAAKVSLTNNNTINLDRKPTNRIDPANYDNDIQVYFKQSSNHTDRFRCLLCSIELNLSTESSPTLVDHLRLQHAIERDSTTSSDKGESNRAQQVTNNIRKVSRAKNSQDNRTHELSASMTNHKHQRFKSDDGKPQHKRASNNSTTTNHDISVLRRNLDLFEYDDLSKASLKPLPSASLSRTLFSRLNQLSEPVTRKLKFWNKKSFQVNSYDPCFKVIYLGNLGMQYWSKDESCLEKPLNTLWNNYLVNMKTEIVMRLTICNSGLKAITRQHGLTQYWSNRLVYCCSHKNYPKVFSWIYRHEGKKMRQELRCHAVFCSSPERASKMVTLLNQRLACALQEFKREKKSRGAPSIIGNESLTSNKNPLLTQQTLPRTIPLRRQILAKGSANFRPPLERSKSAPKLMSIREEEYEFEEDEEDNDDDDDDDPQNQYVVADDDEDISHDEYEYEQSFGDRDEEDEDQASDYDELGEDKHDDDNDDDSAHRIDSNSLATTGNEETSNSSVYATGDISYDNIIMNKQHLATNQERLDCASTLTAPAGTTAMSSSSFRRSTSSRKSTRMAQNYQRPIQSSRHQVEDPPSLTNSIEVDMNHFGEEEEEEDPVGGATEDRSQSRASSHNSKTSANTKLQQESISSLDQTSSNKIDIGHSHHKATQAASGNSRQAKPHSWREGDSDKTNAAPDDNIPRDISEHQMRRQQQEHKSSSREDNSKPPEDNLAMQREQHEKRDTTHVSDRDDSATQDIVLSLSRNLSIK